VIRTVLASSRKANNVSRPWVVCLFAPAAYATLTYTRWKAGLAGVVSHSFGVIRSKVKLFEVPRQSYHSKGWRLSLLRRNRRRLLVGFSRIHG
jgi:hypothetical protein